MKPQQPIINQPSALSGFMTILLLAIVITIVIISIVDIANKKNKIETATVVPKEVVGIEKVQGYYSLIVLLHSYGDPDCKPSQTPKVEGFDGNYNVKSQLYPNSTCMIHMTCSNCSLKGSSQIVEFTLQQTFAMASSIDYILTLPYFVADRPVFNISERIVPENTSNVFRGKNATQVSMFLTTTLYTTIDSFDFFMYNLLSRLLKANLT